MAVTEITMAVTQIALGLLCNLFHDSGKEIHDKLYTPSMKAHNKAIKELKRKNERCAMGLDDFLKQKNANKIINEIFKEFQVNKTEQVILKRLTDEFIASFEKKDSTGDVYVEEHVTDMLNDYFEILNREIESDPDLLQALDHHILISNHGLLESINKNVTKEETPENETDVRYNDFLDKADEKLRNKDYKEALFYSLQAYELNKNNPKAIIIYGRAAISEMCNKFSDKTKKVLVIGDLMLDHTLIGQVAKYPTVASHHNIEKVYMLHGKNSESHTLGGVGYLGRAFSVISEKVIIIGAIGDDYVGKLIEDIYAGRRDIKGKFPKEKENLVKDSEFIPIKDNEIITTTKIYFYMNTQNYKPREGVRLDREDREAMKDRCLRHKNEIIEKFESCIIKSSVDCIVISDYEKGLITEELLKEISDISKKYNKKIFVSPKSDWSKFKDIDIEAMIADNSSILSGLNFTPPGIAEKLEEYPYIKNVIVRECQVKEKEYAGPQNGAHIIYKDKKSEWIKKLSREESNYISDVGCGNVFNAFFIISMLNNCSLKRSVLLANYAACLKLNKPIGDIVTSKEILKEVIDEVNYFKYNKNHIINLMENNSM